MKNIGTMLAAAILAVVLVLYMCTFQVRFTEVAIKKTFGKPGDSAITDPGLKLKWPWPLQSVVVYDKRIRILEDRTAEIRTVDGKNVLLTTFTAWRIKDPSEFHTNFPGGVEDGESLLRSIIVTGKQAVTGQHTLAEFVSTDPAKRKIRQMEQEMKAAVAENSQEQFGIEVVDFGIKKLGLPASTTSAIFEAMKENERRKANEYQEQGKATAVEILATANATEQRIMAVVDRKVAGIRDEAQQKVSEYYKEFDEYPHLRIFLDSLRTMKTALRERSTLVLSTKEAPWDVFTDEGRAAVPLRDGIRPAEPDEASPKESRTPSPGTTD